MTNELTPKFNPTEVEAGRYEKWLEADVFKPSGNPDAEPYSIVIPPPNVTGKLHLGHCLGYNFARYYYPSKTYARFDTLWLPGMDHAGIATQAKVAARLAEDGILPQDLGREKFLIKFGSGKMNMPQQSRNNGVKWGFQWIILVNVLLLMKAFHKRFVKSLFNFTKKVGFTVVKNSSTGIQKR